MNNAADQITLPTLEGQHVVIVGGSSGMGLAVAQRSRMLGAEVTLVGRTEGKLRSAAEKVGGAKVVAADMRDAKAMSELFAAVAKVDHLVITAGFSEVVMVVDGSPDYWRSVLDLRIVAPLDIIKQALPKMTDGSITLTSGSFTEIPPAYGFSILTAAVAGLEALARALARELAPVRVNAISPGFIYTPIFDQTLGSMKDAILNEAVNRLPSKRLGTPADLSAGVIALMTNSYMTAEVLHVDGGMRMVDALVVP
jgi:NAD(P)-dependent dehydrogenase (short-subunit alcohol dehydrogenase family)